MLLKTLIEYTISSSMCFSNIPINKAQWMSPSPTITVDKVKGSQIKFWQILNRVMNLNQKHHQRKMHTNYNLIEGGKDAENADDEIEKENAEDDDDG